MPRTPDHWFIRLPDGQVFRAAGTAIVRQQFALGRLPAGTRLRRSPDDDWSPAERFTEFADLSASSEGSSRNGNAQHRTGSTIASRLDGSGLALVGVRGYLEELLAALDSTLIRLKLHVALGAGLFLGILGATTRLPELSFSLSPPGWGWLLVASGVLVVVWLMGLLARLTFAELSHLRLARLADVRKEGSPLTFRLSLVFGIYAAGLIGLIGVSNSAVDWLPGRDQRPLLGFIDTGIPIGLSMLAQGSAWLLLPLLLTLAPLLVVEQCSLGAGLGQWLRLLRDHAGRLLVAEFLTFLVAFLLALPGAALWWLATKAFAAPATANLEAAVWTRYLLGGLVLSLPLAYVFVANVFIYLKLRYETPVH